MESSPQITVAICTYNRSSYLRQTLADLAAQSADLRTVEIMVINNNSTDTTAEVCTEFSSSTDGMNFRVVSEEKQGLSQARNRALEESLSETLFFIDDDVRLPSDYLEKALQLSTDHPEILAAGGRILVSFDELATPPNWIPKPLMPMFGLHDLGEGNRIYPLSNFPRGGNMMIRKELYRRFGGFDQSLGRMGDQLLGSEEKAFFHHIRQQGIKLWYRGELVLTHRIPPHRLGSDYLRRQSTGIGYSEGVRLSGGVGILKKSVSEAVKLTGSILLAIVQLLRGRWKAALFLLRFRIWVLQGLFRSVRGVR